MPIVHFTRDRKDVPADAVNVRLSTAYRSSTSQEYTRTRLGLPEIPMDAPEGEHPGDLWLYETHVGLCLEDREHNGYNDSDFYMLVWDEEKRAPESICFASTRGWTYPSYGSKVDATPEVRAKYEAWKAARDERLQREHAEWLATQPTLGRAVRVTKRSRKHAGVEGVVAWESRHPVRFSLSRLVDRRIGIRVEGQRGYTFVTEGQVEMI